MTDTLVAPADADRAPRERRPTARRVGAAVVMLAALVVAYGVGAIAGRAAPDSAARADGSDVPWIDAEFDFLGAVATWPSTPDTTTTNPFRGASDAALLTDARTVCTRAGDDGMDAAGMGDLLGIDPHQTYVLVTEAIDKLCPSQRTHLAALRR